MKTATITAAKNGLSALIDRVKSGESILILDRGVPVARLEPVLPFADATGRLSRLERAGVIKVGAAPPPLALLRTPAPALAPGASSVQVLLRERRSGR
jgi:prevent-host-death family protein